MLDVLFLSIALSRQPEKMYRTDEQEQQICFYSYCPTEENAQIDADVWCATTTANSENTVSAIADFFRQQEFSAVVPEEKFRALAAIWSSETSHVSSTTRAISSPNYQAIIKLGWDVVPLMLKDLQNNQGYWYPALAAITGIRPFDRKDAGNTRRMTEAWLDWGRKKNLV